ncbi:EAL domain-containing protein [Sphingomonas panacisoli]|uniref:EAL domain-containing protein n=1 Tax=Sphingomonas panacisoli TaxID=1813879 RepID=A0A5B8LHK1_9SPHN|nr:EAL domain-containing protein [Sphingomonas panacisoli]QDZ07521.1 EAL domain-containing protein [Sphingomonas panacisoli]
MRKTRFAAISEPSARVRDLGYLDIFLFDLRPARQSDDERIANERIRGLSNTGPYLLASHLICAIVLAIHAFRSGSDNPLAVVLPLAGVVVLAALSTLLNRRRTKAMRPHQVVRLWGAFTVAIGLLWAIVIAVGLPTQAVSPIILASLLGAFCLTIAAFISVPSLLLVSYAAAVGSFVLFSTDLQILGLLVAFGGCLFFASIFSARGAMIAAGRQLANEYQAQKAARFVAEFEQSGRGWFWETDADGALTYVSTQLADDLKRAASELTGTQFVDLLGMDVGSRADDSECTLGFYLSARVPFADVTVKAKASDDIWWSLSGTAHFDDYGRFIGFSGIGTDLTEQRLAEAEINRLARYDALTGLPNRTLMRATLEDALGSIEKQKKGAALYLIDLDRFKNVNDTLGHPIGDALLKQVAGRLTAVIGKDGQVGRIGGDEFQAVFPSIDSEQYLGTLAQRLIEQVSQPYQIDGNNITIGASVGVAIARSQYQCADALIRDADLALYAAKDDGRGTFKLFSPDMHSDAQEKQGLEQELRGAIQRGELKLVYQPVVNTVTEEVVAFEALARWVRSNGQSVPTEQFIALAEECGLIIAIGEWVLRTAATEAAQWPAQVRIAVNISPTQFASPTLVATVMNVLAATELDPNRLELEITEGVFLSDEANVDETFRRLKSAGVRLALDDFGTGYSSLGYLKRAPLNKIKIDQSFVRGAAATGSTSEAILRSIISLAQSLKMDTTAEGVETHDDLNLIRELGCSQVQGYIFGKPMEVADARTLACSVEAVAAKGYENARAPRYSLIRTANAQWNGMTFTVRIRNIAVGGALLESTRDLPDGAQIQLDIPGCSVIGADVRWSREGKIGVRFERPFNLRDLGPVQRAPANDSSAPQAATPGRLTPADLNRSTAMPKRG